MSPATEAAPDIAPPSWPYGAGPGLLSLSDFWRYFQAGFDIGL